MIRLLNIVLFILIINCVAFSQFGSKRVRADSIVSFSDPHAIVVNDTIYFKSYGRFDSIPIPATPSFGSGNLIGRGASGIRYQYPSGASVNLDSVTLLTNLSGAGIAVYKSRSGVNEQLKRLKNSYGLNITDGTDSVLFAVDTSLIATQSGLANNKVIKNVQETDLSPTVQNVDSLQFSSTNFTLTNPSGNRVLVNTQQNINTTADVIHNSLTTNSASTGLTVAGGGSIALTGGSGQINITTSPGAGSINLLGTSTSTGKNITFPASNGTVAVSASAPVSLSAAGNITLDTSSVGVGTRRYIDSIANAKVDTIYRTAGKDSIQFKINGRYHAIRDSVGSGGGSSYTHQQFLDSVNTNNPISFTKRVLVDTIGSRSLGKIVDTSVTWIRRKSRNRYDESFQVGDSLGIDLVNADQYSMSIGDTTSGRQPSIFIGKSSSKAWFLTWTPQDYTSAGVPPNDYAGLDVQNATYPINISNSGAKVGFGTPTPSAKVEVNGSASNYSTNSENIYFEVNPSNFVQMDDGNTLATQRFSLFKIPSTWAGASTATVGATVAIEGAPPSDEFSYTSAYSLWVQAGQSTFDGDLHPNSTLTGNALIRGSDAFTTTAQNDTVTISGASISDYYFVQATGTGTLILADEMKVEATSTGFIVHRGVAGTSGLTYNWFRIK